MTYSSSVKLTENSSNKKFGSNRFYIAQVLVKE